MSILERFCSVDEVWQQLAPWGQQQVLAAGARQRLRRTRLHPSESMTSAILYFQQSHDRTFKAFYTEHVTEHVQQQLRSEFPRRVSYTRLVELLPTPPCWCR